MRSTNRHSFIRSLKRKGFKEEIVIKIGLYDLVASTTLESNNPTTTLLQTCFVEPGFMGTSATTSACRLRLQSRDFARANLVNLLKCRCRDKSLQLLEGINRVTLSVHGHV